jgi:membrane-bound inhibitor of C-type lysozyme
MRRLIFLAAAFAVLTGAGAAAVSAQTFQSFTCADGTRFVALLDPKVANVQIDGKAVALKKRFTLTGARYTGRGITLTMNKKGTLLRHGKRGPTSCTQM